MTYLLLLQLCTFTTLPTIHHACDDSEFYYKTMEACESQAKRFNTELKVKRTYQGDKIDVGIAMMKPAVCVVKKAQ